MLHAYREGPGRIGVEARVAAGWLHVLVGDEGGGLTPRTDSPGLGLGLPLIAQMPDESEITVPARGSGTEVCVKFDVSRHGP